MALNFVEQNLTEFLHVPNKHYSTQTSTHGLKNLKQENLFVWKILHAATTIESKDILWLNAEEELLIKQWLEYTNSFVLHAGLQSLPIMLNELNSFFSKNCFLVSNRITLADVFLYYSLISVFKDLSFQSKEKYQHISRWFNFVQSHSSIRRNNEIIPFSKTSLYQ